MAADDAVDHSLVREPVGARVYPVAHAKRVDKGQITGSAISKKTGLEALKNRLGFEKAATRS
jgi:hypothetical protein